MIGFLVVLLASTLRAAGAPPGSPPEPVPSPTPTPAPRVHEEMVVTADRGPEPREEAPASVSVLTREEIARVPARDLSELLEFLPGFHALFREGFGGPPPIVTSRGFFGGGEAEYVQLRVDGVPVADAESGLVDWRRIRAEDVERIEALRGPASSLYGDTALGGVVQVFTRTGPPNGSALGVSASGGSFGAADADVSYGYGAGDFRADANGGYARADGYRQHDSEESGVLGLTTSGSLGGGKWTLDAQASRATRQDPGALDLNEFDQDISQSDSLFRFDRTEADRGRLALSYALDAGPVPFRATAYGSLRSSTILRTLLEAPGVGNRTVRDLHSTGFGGIIDARRDFLLLGGDGVVRAGTELARDALRTNYRFVDDDGAAGPIVSREEGHRNRSALFATTEWSPVERFRITGGVRWDRISDDFQVEDTRAAHEAWSPRVGGTLLLGDLAGAPVSAYVQWSRSFKAPTLDQLFDPHPFDDFQGGTFSISNPNLVPARARNLEVGLSQRSGNLRWEALAYRMTVDDEIDFDPNTFSYRNINNSLHRGVEASGHVALGFLTPFVSYAWTRVESRSGDHVGKQLKNIPEHLVRAGVSASLPAGVSADAIWTWMGKRYLDDDDVFPLGDASVVDLRLSRTFGAIRARLDLSNLTNTRYSQYGFALADFSGGVAPFYYPGARFAARFGIDWRP